MSLKTFHLIFITVASLFCFWFGAWMWRAYQSEGVPTDLYYAIGSGLAGVTLVVYECFFLKKLSKVSFL